MTDQSRGGSYIDDGTGPVHVDDLPKADAPAPEPALEPAPEPAPVTEPTETIAQETTDA